MWPGANLIKLAQTNAKCMSEVRNEIMLAVVCYILYSVTCFPMCPPEALVSLGQLNAGVVCEQASAQRDKHRNSERCDRLVAQLVDVARAQTQAHASGQADCSVQADSPSNVSAPADTSGQADGPPPEADSESGVNAACTDAPVPGTKAL